MHASIVSDRLEEANFLRHYDPATFAVAKKNLPPAVRWGARSSKGLPDFVDGRSQTVRNNGFHEKVDAAHVKCAHCVLVMPLGRKHTRKGERCLGLPWHAHAGRYGLRKSRSRSEHRRHYGMVRPDARTSHNGPGSCCTQSRSSCSPLDAHSLRPRHARTSPVVPQGPHS
jgi:hypothetical protein